MVKFLEGQGKTVSLICKFLNSYISCIFSHHRSTQSCHLLVEICNHRSTLHQEIFFSKQKWWCVSIQVCQLSYCSSWAEKNEYTFKRFKERQTDLRNYIKGGIRFWTALFHHRGWSLIFGSFLSKQYPNLPILMWLFCTYVNEYYWNAGQLKMHYW